MNQLGCYRPDAFRAIAPAAGGLTFTDCTKSVGAMIVHGSGDTTVPLSSGQASRDYWLYANGCSGAPSQPISPPPCVAYSGCANPVIWCQHGGGHAWPAFAGQAIRDFFFGL